MSSKRLLSVGVASLVASFSCVTAHATGAHTVRHVYLDSGNPGTTLVAGDNIASAISVNCPNAHASCTLALTAMDQVCSTFDGGIFVITVTVDGTPVDAGQFEAQIYNTCQGGNWQGIATVTSGAHSIRLDTYVPPDNFANGVTQGQWSVSYTVTTP
jgi:hypothetical protein